MPKFHTPLAQAHIGGMYTGKTKTLIDLVLRAIQLRNEETVIVTPAIDTRPHTNSLAIVEDHDGRPLLPHPLLTHVVLPESGPAPELPSSVQRVVIDEAQFFGKWVSGWVDALALRGIYVDVFALDTDYQGRSWPTTGEILAVVDAIVKHHGICARCGGESSRTQRLTNSPGKVLVGGDGLYEPRCRRCHTLPERHAEPSDGRATFSYHTDADGRPPAESEETGL